MSAFYYLALLVSLALPDYHLVAHAVRAAEREQIPHAILLAQITEESSWRVDARSSHGAVGIAQIIAQYHPGVDPYDPWASIDYMATEDRRSLDKYGSWAMALAAWNAGGPTVERYGGVPDYPETQRYVAEISARSGIRER